MDGNASVVDNVGQKSRRGPDGEREKEDEKERSDSEVRV